MRITRFEDPLGRTRFGIDRGEGEAELLQGDLFQGLEKSGETVAIQRRLAPLVPTNILCIGLNYHAHAEETGQSVTEHPILFMKNNAALNHPDAEILLPACCTRGPEVDYEAELAVVIGTAARNVSREQALQHVLGYTCANDVSARRWQRHAGGGQWVRGKSFDSFCPLGPVLVTADEIPDPQTLGVRCLLNGELMQDGNTSDMIFPVDRLISELSRDTTLLPGTVILTGTPAGVGVARTPPVFLSAGDKVTVEIENIGQLSNTVVDLN
jgi:2-keto-4-pentenoate hydratase/2-oxohepta-3-ene-1,7-dioic acid hydratase in catechol pathway